MNMKRKLLYSLCAFLFLSSVQLKAQNFSIPPIANFAYDFGIDTVWQNSQYTFVNTSTNDSANYWDIVPRLDGPITVPGFGQFTAVQSGGNRHFRYTFTDTGSFWIKLVVRNRSGSDSILKRIYVGIPTKRPVASFYIDKQVIGLSEWVPLYDLSQNGPTQWAWTLNPPCRANCLTGPNDFIAPNGIPNNALKQPFLRARDPGVYDICLKVTNNVGSDSVCIKNYVQIIGGTSACAGPQDTFSTQENGYVYDNGGPNQQYFSQIMGNCFYRIDPCASQVSLFIEYLDLRPADNIVFRDGGATGPIIQTLSVGGNALTPAQRNIVANSGVLWFRFNVGAGNSTPADSGFVFRWTSVAANYGPPQAKFSCPDTVYSGYNVQYKNESTGLGNLYYAWDQDGIGSTNDYQLPNGANATFTTLAPISRNICLWVTNCKGTNMFCKRIVILPISTTPAVDFTSPRPAGFTTDLFSLVDKTSNGATSWLWTITPNNVVYRQGTSATSQNPVFNLTVRGFYTVKLRATNALGTDSAIKTLYLSVLAYSSPNTEWPIASGNDIGISRVRFANVDTATGLKTPIYDTLFVRWTGLLFRGVDYPLQVSRLTANSAMDRKAWVDFNLDGDFLDNGELVMNEQNAKTITGVSTFRIPNDILPGRVTRLRVGVSEGNSSLTPDRSTSGCFEDYGLEIGLDTIRPTIQLKGPQLLRIELNKSFVDPGVTAFDNREGDISSRYERITNVDTSVTGFYWAKYYVKDLYDLVSDTVVRQIQVEINRTGPKISLNGPDSVFISAPDGVYTPPVPTAVDNLGMPLTADKITRIGEVNTKLIGNYRVVFTVVDQFGFIDSAVQRVFVRDVTKPFLRTFDSTSQVITHQVATPYQDEQIVRRDEYYKDVNLLLLTRTGSVNTSVPGSYNLIYNLCDPSGNCAEPLYVQVDVKDAIPPNVTLLGPNPVEVNVFEGFNDPEIFYFDNYYDNSSLVTFKTGNVDYNKIGEYNLTYSVRDGGGNQTSVVRKINVVDKSAPRIEILGGSPFELAYMDTFNDPGVKLIDNYYSDADLQLLLKTTSTLEKANGKYYGGARGWKEIKYNLTDPSGNVAREMKRSIFVEFRSGLLNVVKQNAQLTVYPNPNNGTFKVALKNNLSGPVKVNMYNVLGAQVYSEALANGISNGHEIKTNDLDKGIYLLQITHQGKVITQKITIQ